MITESLKQVITSVSDDELDKLYQRYLDEADKPSEDGFAIYLHHNNFISHEEFKNIQAQARIELTSLVDVADANKTGLVQVKEPPDPNKNIYTVIESIGKGAMGEILVARDNQLGRKVAYKKILPDIAEIPSYMARFYTEAQITAQLQHPSIVPIYSMVHQDNSVGYTMKLVNGVTFKDFMRDTMRQYDKQGEPDEHHTLHARLEHFLKVCDALHYAHRKGVIHRDLKPVNIMIGSYNEVYVMDWGIAKTVDVNKETFGDKTMLLQADHEETASDKTMVGQVLGTPAYMSPEQAMAQNDTLDHRSDLFSLGLILLELVTFFRARSGKNIDETLNKARQGIIDARPTYSKQADFQEQLLAIVKKATMYSPEDRYDTVEDLADDIRRFIHGEAIHAREETLRQKFMRWTTHHRIATANMFLFTTLMFFILIAIILYQQFLGN